MLRIRAIQKSFPFFCIVIGKNYEKENPVGCIAGNTYSHHHPTLHAYGFQQNRKATLHRC
jgi:hypothetical protein